MHVVAAIREYRSVPSQEVPIIDSVICLSGEGAEEVEDGDPISPGEFEDTEPASTDGIDFVIANLVTRQETCGRWTTGVA